LLRWESGKPRIEGHSPHWKWAGASRRFAALATRYDSRRSETGCARRRRRRRRALPRSAWIVGAWTTCGWGPMGSRCGSLSVIAMSERWLRKRPAGRDELRRSSFTRSPARSMRLNSVYQLLADPAAGIDAHAPGIMMPEFVLYWLGARAGFRVHAGLAHGAGGFEDRRLV